MKDLPKVSTGPEIGIIYSLLLRNCTHRYKPRSRQARSSRTMRHKPGRAATSGVSGVTIGRLRICLEFTCLQIRIRCPHDRQMNSTHPSVAYSTVEWSKTSGPFSSTAPSNLSDKRRLKPYILRRYATAKHFP